MFSSEKVLQMSYANYQYVASAIPSLALLNAPSEERKHWLKSSKTLVSWTNAKRGAQKSFTQTPDQNKDYLSHFRRLLTFGGRSAAHSTAALYMYLELLEDPLPLR